MQSQSKFAPGALHPGIKQTSETIAGLAEVPALSLRAVLRTAQGFRRLSASSIAVTTFVVEIQARGWR
jgi:hypothetical protein